jgi:hypothetical protein
MNVAGAIFTHAACTRRVPVGQKYLRLNSFAFVYLVVLSK